MESLVQKFYSSGLNNPNKNYEISHSTMDSTRNYRPNDYITYSNQNLHIIPSRKFFKSFAHSGLYNSIDV